MIYLGIEKNEETKKSLFRKNGLEINENSDCVTAVCSEELLGYCLYDMTDKQIIIRFLYPQDDLSLADGILRSTLHVAAERFVMDARYEDDSMRECFKKLQFIKSEDDKTLNIDKLFESCKSCK